MKYTVKRISAGLYEYTFTNGLVFRIIGLRDECAGRWVYTGGMNEAEGGDDHFYSKREALAALLDYVAHRAYNEQLQCWCYTLDS